MTLNHLRIGPRLILAFAIVAAIALLGDLFALTQLSDGNDRLRRIVMENNAKLEHANDMSDAVHVESRVLRSLILLNDPGTREAQTTKIVTARAAFDQARTRLHALPAERDEQQLREAIDAATAAARSVYDRVQQLAHGDRDAEATALVLGEGLQASSQLQDALDSNLAHIKTHNLQKYELSQVAHQHAVRWMVFVALLALAVSGLLTWVLTRSIVRPIAQAVAVANTMAEGRLDADITVRGRDEAAALLQAMASMQHTLSGLVSSVRGNAQGVATASTQIAQGNLDLSQRTEQQASALQQTAASMEQLNSAVQQNAQSARQANQLASGASDVASQGGVVVTEMVTTMREIDQSSRRIADIIGMIDTIAFQTNILALNAAVEAARAGDQGRGFAVVASEVRSLAGRSAEAAREIKALIAESVTRVTQGSALADRAGSSMQNVVAAIQRVTDLMGEISAASSEQSQGVAEVGKAISQMDQVTQQNSALVEESAAAAESLRQQADCLVQAVEMFRTATEPAPA